MRTAILLFLLLLASAPLFSQPVPLTYSGPDPQYAGAVTCSFDGDNSTVLLFPHLDAGRSFVRITNRAGETVVTRIFNVSTGAATLLIPLPASLPGRYEIVIDSVREYHRYCGVFSVGMSGNSVAYTYDAAGNRSGRTAQ